VLFWVFTAVLAESHGWVGKAMPLTGCACAVQDVEGHGFDLDDFMQFCFAVVENAGAIANVMATLHANQGLTPGG